MTPLPPPGQWWYPASFDWDNFILTLSGMRCAQITTSNTHTMEVHPVGDKVDITKVRCLLAASPRLWSTFCHRSFGAVTRAAHDWRISPCPMCLASFSNCATGCYGFYVCSITASCDLDLYLLPAVVSWKHMQFRAVTPISSTPKYRYPQEHPRREPIYRGYRGPWVSSCETAWLGYYSKRTPPTMSQICYPRKVRWFEIMLLGWRNVRKLSWMHCTPL